MAYKRLSKVVRLFWHPQFGQFLRWGPFRYPGICGVDGAEGEETGMAEAILNDLRVGSRVWTASGYQDHGPLDGPKVTIPANVGGSVIATEKPYYTIDQLLYVVRWDTGQTSKHYFKQLFCIGHFTDLKVFEEAVITASGTAELVLGPQGGFREMGAELVLADGSSVRLGLFEGQGRFWEEILQPMFRKSAIELKVTRLQAKSSRRSRNAE